MSGTRVDTAASVRGAVVNAPLIDSVPGAHLLALGKGWDALRVPATLGALALALLRQSGEELGPVLHDAPGQRFYFVVPLGTVAAYWLPFPVKLLSAGSWLVTPNPYCAADWFGGWCELPDDSTLTDTARLRSALQPPDDEAS